MFSLGRRFVAVSATAVVLAGAASAFAIWGSEGAGRGPAETSARGALVVNVDPAGLQGLYPGATTTVHFTVKNESDHPVWLRGARPYGFAVDAGHADCLSEHGTLTGSEVVLHGNLAVGASSPRHQVRIALAKRAGDACKGARFTFRLDVSAYPVG